MQLSDEKIMSGLKLSEIQVMVLRKAIDKLK